METSYAKRFLWYVHVSKVAVQEIDLTSVLHFLEVNELYEIRILSYLLLVAVLSFSNCISEK
jgi:hypothetical protein